jgi:ribosomal protein L20A (L18A)
MANIEKRVIKSFHLAKNDIYDLKGKVESLLDMQRKLEKTVRDLRKDEVRLYEMVHKKKSSGKKVRTRIIKINAVSQKHHHAFYIAKKGGKKFHIKNCPFAQNIIPKNKVIFRSKTKALNKGFKPCKCIK